MPDRQDSDREVLTSLPRSRPVRRSAKRGDRPEAPSEAPAKAAAKPATKAASRREPAAAKPRSTSRSQPAAEGRRTPRPTPGADRPGTERQPGEPERKVPPAGYATPNARDDRADAGSGSAAADLVGTAIQAAGELAQIGMEVGRQTLRSMLDRLPKP